MLFKLVNQFKQLLKILRTR